MLALTHTLRRANFRTAARAFSSKASEAPQFDPEMVKAYNTMSANHRHPLGPWKLMSERVQKFNKTNPVILDLASGPGEPAATIAAAMPNARVISTDVSEDMVAAATNATKDLTNVETQVADAQDLKQFQDASIDIVTCCYGYMFPTDKDQALEETYRVLKPGGMLVATTWDNVDILKISRDVMTEVLGATPPAPPLNPMSLSEEGLFEGMVSKAGFTDIEQSTSTYPFKLGSDKSFQVKIGTLLLKDKIDEFGEAGWNKAEAAFWDNIGKYTTEEDGEMVMPANTFRLTVAKK